MTKAKNNLPAYADNHSSFPSFSPPYFQKEAKLTAFLFQAELKALAALCDSLLNVSDGFPYRYEPVSASVMLVFADMLVSSRNERDEQVGFIPESEVGFWVLTLAKRKTKHGEIPSHLAWFLPYVFVNEGNALTSGREVLGFNKQFAVIEKPARLQKPEFSAQVMGFKQFGHGAVAKMETLLHVRPYASPRDESRQDFSAIQSSFFDTLLRAARTGMDKILLRIGSRVLNDAIPLVFLKQFRDAQNPALACYQSIVKARLKVEKFRQGGIFLKPYMLRLFPLASHPLAQNLGLKESQPSKIGAWMDVDFSIGGGKIEEWVTDISLSAI